MLHVDLEKFGKPFGPEEKKRETRTQSFARLGLDVMEFAEKKGPIKAGNRDISDVPLLLVDTLEGVGAIDTRRLKPSDRCTLDKLYRRICEVLDRLGFDPDSYWHLEGK